MAFIRDLWVLIEKENLEEYHLELLSGARQIADALGENVCCMVLGPSTKGAADALESYGADRIYTFDLPSSLQYCSESAEFYVQTVQRLLMNLKPRKIFCADNSSGRDLACRLAARMKVGIITGCVHLSLGENDFIVLGKSTHEGKTHSTFFRPVVSLEVATVKTGILEKKRSAISGKPERISITPDFSYSEKCIKTLGFEKADPDQISLEEAEVVIAGGRGMGSSEDFSLLERLGKSMGGVVAGSLAAVDEGWISRKKLVGQTGTSVEPKLYIACGISGSIYHLLGMKASRFILAVNKDRYAPIFKYADFGIIGDVAEIIPVMLDRLKGLAQVSCEGDGLRNA